ncbi:protein phosphatase 2C domain-containing protein [Natronobacterium gregoryi]|uniref:Protein serine/threonine phosphatase n=2 Tax=Natronobacterium gregoryi TaxID=44930 RepID=L0AJC8_NATGS|nr:protein phosphatase 2C domain-containing protein [Natronobacterium gregoryi]AFZ73277.1 serine/threonine protein phosphatase [Natronobacterium gregoryi SP2]ELY71263.1 protein serine/threonine phosphatase [Natronobacterium gregoryi SP2]PLK18777.1 serine/threonine protein phosphatase [Natronobacterium gregoryi SP2]SFJ64677.1 Serine/threonine protein phosphatase PrpC [Natronobacterium gregoryi]
MEHASTVDIGERKRRSGGINEDSIATAVLENHHRSACRPLGIFVLGDGVGGETSGDVASFLATTVVRKRLTETLLGSGTDLLERFDLDVYGGEPPTADENPASALSPRRIRAAIQDAVDDAHQHVQEYARRIDGQPATTLVVAVSVDGRLHYGWVGDSRLYLVNERHERIQQLTTDHAVTNDLLEQGEIEDEVGARVHESATAITNAVGGSPHGKPTVDVEFGSTDIYREDIVLLTSDGLIDAYPDIAPLRAEYERVDDTEAVREEILEALVTDDEIRDIVLEADGLREGVADLIAFANDRGGKDNLSVTLARDPTADPSPEDISKRSEAIESDGLIDQETVIETPGSDDGYESTDRNASAKSLESAADVVSATDTDLTTASIKIAGTETIYEIVDGVTIGRDNEEADGAGPNICLVVEDDAVERHHTRIERDDDGNWWLRNTSDAGTFVEDDGEWVHLQSGADDGTTSDSQFVRGGPEAYRLQDGTTFTLEDPRETDPIAFKFFSSVGLARDRIDESESDDAGLLDRFRS